MNESETQLKRCQTLMRNALDGIHIMDVQGDVVEVNESFCNMLGYSYEEACRLNITDWNSQWSKDELLARIKSLVGKSARFETVHRRKDGTLINVEISTTGVKIEGLDYFFASSRDITERKKAERELKVREERFQTLFNSASEGILILSTSGKFIAANESFARMHGYTVHEIQAMNLRDLDPPDALAQAPERIRRILTEGALTFEVDNYHKDGHTFPVEVSASLIMLDGEPVIQSFSRDITERRLAEKQLRKSQSSLNAAQKLAHIGSWEWDVRNNNAQWTDETYQIFGIDKNDLNEHRENFLDMIVSEDRAQVDQALSDALDGTSDYNIEYRVRLTDGVKKTIHALAEVIRDEEGKPTLMRGTVQDITERKLAEQKIKFLSRIYAAQSHTNQALIESKDEATLFKRICQIVVEFGGMELAWIGINDERTGLVKPLAAHGRQTDYLDDIVISSREDVPEGRGPSGIACRQMRSVFVQELKTDPRVESWRQRISKYDWGSSGTVPLIRSGKSYAVLVFYHTREHIFTQETIDLLNEMGRNIGYGLNRFDLEKEKLIAQESMRLAATIYRSSVEAIMVTDEYNLIIDVNPAFTTITGYTLEDVIGKNPRVLQSGKHNKEFYREMWQSIVTTGHWEGELWDRRKNGELHAKHASISVIRNPDGSIYRHVAQFFDITDKKLKEELIWKQANFDTLTNLPNRHMFRNRLEEELLKSQGNGLPVALLIIDLDRFKEINDTLGHSKGDTLLVEAAHRVRMCVRITDMVARLGGDEFTVILPEFGERFLVERITQDIISELAKPFDLGDGQKGYISASIGITIYPNDTKDIGSLLKNADQAMYAAKTEGRNRFSYFTKSMQLEASEKLTLTNDLRHALARNELHVYYQPILELQNGNITKAEALLRWKHPTRGMVSPAIFIPLAEEAGLIHEIGDWVFQEAVICVAAWHKLCGRLIQISVNKSPVQFEQPESQNWQDLMTKLGVPGHGITVEITEGLLLKESAKAKERLLEFRNRGIEVSIDDFGTGFSSLSYLKLFDIDYLKIDRSFVKDLEKNEDDKALTEAIIVMAHKLGIKTIAEGVETAGQRDLLQAFGCDYVQGFLYSPAVPAVEFEKLIVGRSASNF